MTSPGGGGENLLRSDRELEQITVGPQRPYDAPIDLVEYDPGWPRLFSREANRLQAVLGLLALRLEHVGSTAVPGLVAKPIIDIALVVSDSGDEPTYVPRLEAAGYVLRIREPDWYQHRLFKGPDTDVNLHVFSLGAEEIDRMGWFRDHLRNNGPDRDRYTGVKRDLAQHTWRHVQHYADAKTNIIQEILKSVTPVTDPVRPALLPRITLTRVTDHDRRSRQRGKRSRSPWHDGHQRTRRCSDHRRFDPGGNQSRGRRARQELHPANRANLDTLTCRPDHDSLAELPTGTTAPDRTPTPASMGIIHCGQND